MSDYQCCASTWIQVFKQMVLDPNIKNLTQLDPKI